MSNKTHLSNYEEIMSDHHHNHEMVDMKHENHEMQVYAQYGQYA